MTANADLGDATDLPADDVPARAGLGAASWVDGGQAVLDAAGQILSHNDALGVWLGGGDPDSGLGVAFWDLLQRRFPASEMAIQSLRVDPVVFASIDLEGSGDETDGGWCRLERTRVGESEVVRLGSMLAPGKELAEQGWREAYSGPAAGRELFLRLQRAEAQLQKLSQHWPGVIFSQRPDFDFHFVSGRIEELTGVSLEEWRRRRGRFLDIVHESDVAELQNQCRLSARSGQSVTNTFRIRNVQTGRVSYVLEHRQPSLSRSGLLLGYEGVWLDVTRQTLAEKLLTSAAWKETLAVLTMGLAHDFSNVMAGIHSLSESFLSQLEEGHAFREGLDLIKKSSLQASQLVHRIVNLHLGKPGERNYHDLNQIVGELLELVRKVIPRRIEVISELSPEALPVYVDAVEFRQVIINLALNAADAMPERGRLVLRTARQASRPGASSWHGVALRFPCVCLTVADNGTGIRPSHRDAVFDPFFTTKAGGKGSGLGLYNARLFAEKHQGGIALDSEEKVGTSFYVCLPEADFTESERAESAAGPEAQRRGLLLFASSDSLAGPTAEMLRTEGYHVAVAKLTEQAGDILGGGDYLYEGVFIVLESAGTSLAPAVASWVSRHPRLRVILRPLGRDGDDLEPELVRLADLVLNPELSQRSLLEKLRATLSR
ncbi:MAG: PAS domain-containing protein [Verrucomicrobiales bacterium]|nr:PAS domain-containing protein [Verrucomicrobiales bacterium]